mmetsp:Transcript_12171/g.25656  ORF Transcript_12171/g.25656 Transcript_12171/m.25656 type:complete len:120 (-) Transcript_12171:1020-1379(-)
MIRSAATHLTRRLAASSSSLASSSAAPISNRSLAPAIAKQTARSIHIEKKIEQLGIELPPAPLPKANYNIVCLPPGDETTMYVSGHLPIKVRVVSFAVSLGLVGCSLLVLVWIAWFSVQ